MIGEIRIADRRSYRDATAVDGLDLIEWQAMDVDHLSRTFDVELHKIEQRRASRKETNRGAVGLAVSGRIRGVDRLADIGDAFKLKGFHERAPLKLCDESAGSRPRCSYRRHSGRYSRSWPPSHRRRYDRMAP